MFDILDVHEFRTVSYPEQERGYTRAGRKLSMVELFVGLNTGLAVSEDADPPG